MKTTIALLLLVFSVYAFAQNSSVTPLTDTFIPVTLTAGTQMSGRTCATTYSDTTRAFNSRGYPAIYVGLETATNDTVNPLIVAYQVSKDGSSWGPFTVVDSCNFTSGELGRAKYFALPANVLGAYQTRVLVYGRVGGAYSSPAATVTTKIIRVLNSIVKIR